MSKAKQVTIKKETAQYLLDYLESEEIDRSGMFSREGLALLKQTMRELREAIDGS